MEKLMPEQLKELWQSVAQKELSTETIAMEQGRLLAGYAKIWTDALALTGFQDLEGSLFHELGLFTGCSDPAEIKRRCEQSVESLAQEWRDRVDPADPRSVEQFYNQSAVEIYDLIWWHILSEDLSPLGYVTALQFALRENCGSCLDFGSGIGAGSLLFVKHGLEVGLADISSPLLGFSRWRFQLRNLSGEFFDLKKRRLPSNAFDMVTAMDVFEHLANPPEAVERLWHTLKPGGFLFGRFHAERDEDRPLHIVEDFAPTFKRLASLDLFRSGKTIGSGAIRCFEKDDQWWNRARA